jgi:hypothetical protein
MKSTQSGPKCPNAKRLETLSRKVDEVHHLNLDESEVNDIVDALDWLATFLENRALYHKKIALKNKILIQLALERGLGDEATKLANDEVFNVVANEPPDEEVA